MSRLRSFIGRWINSLLVRLTSLLLAIVLLSGIMGSIYLYLEIQDVLTTLLERRIETFSKELTISLSVMLADQNDTGVQSLIDRLSVDDESVEDIVVFDVGGEILARYQSASNEDQKDEESIIESPSWNDLKPVLRNGESLRWQNSRSYTLAAPILNTDLGGETEERVIGVVLLRMNIDAILAQKRNELILRGLFNLFMLVLLTSLIAPLIYFSLIRQLSLVRDAAQKITEGSLDTSLPVKGAHEVAVLADTFNQMASRLKSSQMELENRVKEMTILYEISAFTNQTFNLNEMLAGLANHLAHLVDATGAFITLWDEDRQAPVPQAAYGSFNAQYRTIQAWPDEPTLTAKVLETGKPIVVPDTLNSPYISYRIASQFPDKSLLGLPLIVNNRPIGAVLIGETRRQRVFTETEIQMAMTAAGQIATAIANAQLFSHLESEQKQLSDVINSVTDAILVLDLNGRVRSSNRAFSDLTGVEVDEHAHLFIWEVMSIPIDQVPAIKAEIDAVFAQENNWRRETVALRRDGSTYDADISISKIQGPNGQMSGYVVTLRDISSLKELDRMKNRFVSTVSHELRTPLSVINLHTENLLEFYDRLDDPKRIEMLQDIHAETNNLYQLIEDLLSLSRLDSGRAEPRRAYFSLGELLAETVATFKPLAIEKGVELDVEIANDLLTVYADRDQMRQVFRNLLSNAVKFTLAGGRVWLEVTREKDRAFVHVADTGIGIPEDALPRLFERFYRSELSIQHEIPGSGLGLSISREILLRHQGTIDVQSEVGKGTSIQVSVPLSSSRWSSREST